jgi:hypothetical protein
MESNNNINTNNLQQKDNNIYYSNDDYKNLCVECGVDMGSSNPRQYCGKTYCRNINYKNNTNDQQ